MSKCKGLFSALSCALALAGCASEPSDAGNGGNGTPVLPPSTVNTPPSTVNTPPPTVNTPPPTVNTPPPTTTPTPTGMAGSGAIDMPMAGSGGIVTTPTTTGITTTKIEYNDPNMKCFEFRAHAPGDLQQPMQVGIANDMYLDVIWEAPWTGTVYARSFKSLIGNPAAIHHWLFYQGGPDGSRSLVAGWAPGGTDSYMSPDLGVELPQQQYSIQYHYNSDDPAATDTSGLEVCYTTTKPETVATVSWLGTDGINGTSATGTCIPNNSNRVHILAGTPHMHKKGIHFKVEINRKAGGVEIAHDDAFDFAYQVQYPEDIWIEPGDTITTTCTYNQPTSFGPGTDSEMCYWFAVHYPANSLVDDGILGKVIHGPNACLGM